MPRKQISIEVKDRVFRNLGKLTIKQASIKHKLSTGTIWNIFNNYHKQESIVIHKSPFMNTFTF